MISLRHTRIPKQTLQCPGILYGGLNWALRKELAGRTLCRHRTVKCASGRHFASAAHRRALRKGCCALLLAAPSIVALAQSSHSALVRLQSTQDGQSLCSVAESTCSAMSAVVGLGMSVEAVPRQASRVLPCSLTDARATTTG